MFRFLCRRQRTVCPGRDLALTNSNALLGSLQNKIFSIRLLSCSLHVKRARRAKEKEQEPSLTISYLMNSCGLSLKSAISASKNVKLNDKDKADSVLRLLRDYGFSDTQISKVVRICPQVVTFDPKRKLLPKFEFFRSIGVSRKQLVKILSWSPKILSRSVENHLTPNYNYLKNLLLLDEKVVKALNRNPRSLLENLGSTMTPNIALLKEIGMPQSLISFLVTQKPSAIVCKHSRFCKIVNEVKEMGFNPLKSTFVSAIFVFTQIAKSTRELKIEVYKRWGWSIDEALAAFRRNPECMLLSEDNIARTMDFFVNKMGWLPQDIAKVPSLLLFSLEKRIVPRFSVVRVLLSKGLIREALRPATILKPSEIVFVERYVTKFQEEIPELLNVYNGKSDLLNVNPVCEMKQV